MEGRQVAVLRATGLPASGSPPLALYGSLDPSRDHAGSFADQCHANPHTMLATTPGLPLWPESLHSPHFPDPAYIAGRSAEEGGRTHRARHLRVLSRYGPAGADALSNLLRSATHLWHQRLITRRPHGQDCVTFASSHSLQPIEPKGPPVGDYRPWESSAAALIQPRLHVGRPRQCQQSSNYSPG